jgi:hypothetical protein
MHFAFADCWHGVAAMVSVYANELSTSQPNAERRACEKRNAEMTQLSDRPPSWVELQSEFSAATLAITSFQKMEGRIKELVRPL